MAFAVLSGIHYKKAEKIIRRPILSRILTKTAMLFPGNKRLGEIFKSSHGYTSIVLCEKELKNFYMVVYDLVLKERV